MQFSGKLPGRGWRDGEGKTNKQKAPEGSVPLAPGPAAGPCGRGPLPGQASGGGFRPGGLGDPLSPALDLPARCQAQTRQRWRPRRPPRAPGNKGVPGAAQLGRPGDPEPRAGPPAPAARDAAPGAAGGAPGREPLAAGHGGAVRRQLQSPARPGPAVPATPAAAQGGVGSGRAQPVRSSPGRAESVPRARARALCIKPSSPVKVEEVGLPPGWEGGEPRSCCFPRAEWVAGTRGGVRPPTPGRALGRENRAGSPAPLAAPQQPPRTPSILPGAAGRGSGPWCRGPGRSTWSPGGRTPSPARPCVS